MLFCASPTTMSSMILPFVLFLFLYRLLVLLLFPFRWLLLLILKTILIIISLVLFEGTCCWGLCVLNLNHKFFLVRLFLTSLEMFGPSSIECEFFIENGLLKLWWRKFDGVGKVRVNCLISTRSMLVICAYKTCCLICWLFSSHLWCLNFELFLALFFRRVFKIAALNRDCTRISPLFFLSRWRKFPLYLETLIGIALRNIIRTINLWFFFNDNKFFDIGSNFGKFFTICILKRIWVFVRVFQGLLFLSSCGTFLLILISLICLFHDRKPRILINYCTIFHTLLCFEITQKMSRRFTKMGWNFELLAWFLRITATKS